MLNLLTSIPVIAIAASFASCTTPTPTRSADVELYRQSRRTGICALHHVPLVSHAVFEYDFAQGTVDWDETGFALVEKYPNVLDPMYSETRSREYPKSVTVRICPVCQQRFDSESKALRR